MLSVDLSRALPPRPYLYFAPFLPGVLFELLIAIGNPQLAAQLLGRLHGATDVGHTLLVCIFLFISFVIGSIFLLVTSLVQWMMRWVFAIGYRLMRLVQRYAILPPLQWATHRWKTEPSPDPGGADKQIPLPPPRWIQNFYTATVTSVGNFPDEGLEAEIKWWDAFARRLLVTRYGFKDENSLPAVSFEPLRELLKELEPEDLRGSAMMNALEAAGWACLAARTLAPVLRHEWYTVVTWFLIGNGLLHDFYIELRLSSRKLGWMLLTKSIMREFPRIGRDKSGPAEKSNEAI